MFCATDFKKNDVVFLIDGSYDSGNGFEEIRGFVEKMVESLNLGSDKDQVAVVQYSRDATVNFYLNSYSSKNDVLNSIRTMRHKSGRPLNIGKALEFVRDNVFTASVGGRRADLVPQYLYAFSGGRSGDDVRGPAQSLKDNGIKTISFGTKNADTLEMQTISYTPANYFYVADFNNLQNIHTSIESTLRGSQETTELPTVTGKKQHFKIAIVHIGCTLHAATMFYLFQMLPQLQRLSSRGLILSFCLMDRMICKQMQNTFWSLSKTLSSKEKLGQAKHKLL